MTWVIFGRHSGPQHASTQNGKMGDVGRDMGQVEKCGPLSTFLKLRQLWQHKKGDWTGPQDAGAASPVLLRCRAEDNDKAITPSIRVKVQPKTFDEKVAQKVRDVRGCHRRHAGEGLLFLQRHQPA